MKSVPSHVAPAGRDYNGGLFNRYRARLADRIGNAILRRELLREKPNASDFLDFGADYFQLCGCSSVDRVLASEAKGRGFDPRQPHQ